MQIPNHIAIVPNGHRRWALEHNKPLPLVYLRGAMRVLRVAGWAKEAGVRHLTFFGLSCENLANRPKYQIDALMKGANKFLDFAGKIGHVHAFGEIDEFQKTEEYQPLYERLKQVNGSYNGESEFVIHPAVNYSGLPRHELRPLLRDLRGIGFSDVEPEAPQHLLSGGVPEVDLFIRTGGEYRTSGLLPFQLAYAELRFRSGYWPDYSKKDFADDLAWFGKQKRNFGK